MRLIDADKLIEELKSAQLCIAGLRCHKSFLGQTMTRYEKFIIKTIEEQPTAFDVDKVLEKLKEVQFTAELEEYILAETNVTELFETQVVQLDEAIEIVKAGGRV